MKNPTEFLYQSLGIVVYDEQGNLLYRRQHLEDFPVNDLAVEIRGIQAETFAAFLLEHFPNFASVRALLAIMELTPGPMEKPVKELMPGLLELVGFEIPLTLSDGRRMYATQAKGNNTGKLP